MKNFNCKRISTLLLLVLLIIAGAWGTNYLKKHPGSIFANTNSESKVQENFDSFLEKLFQSEVSANTINMHYTLRNPENYGITDYKVTYGEVSKESHQRSVAAAENILFVLDGFSTNQMDVSRNLTYEILRGEIETQLEGADFYLYQEILRPSTGVQAELPVLMAEYAFYDEKDVQDYLTLLKQTPEYFHQILLFEIEKANGGLFMTDFAAEDIMNQCRNFVEGGENNYLISTFNDKIDQMQEITDQQKTAYKEQNKEAVLDYVIPAYETMIKGLEKLKGAGKNQEGLCHLPKGKEYYEFLVKSYTGSEKSIEEMMRATEEQRAKDMTEAAKILSEQPELLSQSTSYAFEQEDPNVILQELQGKMQNDFPAPPDINFTIKYVHPSLEEYMAPAFYLSVPIDDITQNSIYINGSNHYQKLKLYTTLAHEGYPGHLYQNVMERSQNFPSIRSLLGSSGYSEGWATYVEMISYSYAEIDRKLSSLLQKDQSALLSLYATADMGIHYKGWSLSDMIDFFGKYQIKDTETLTEIFHLIVEEPAHYLKYYIGYLEFLQLKEYVKDLYGDQYSDYKFHEALMKIGPAQFEIIKKYLPEYYDSSSSS